MDIEGLLYLYETVTALYPGPQESSLNAYILLPEDTFQYYPTIYV